MGNSFDGYAVPMFGDTRENFLKLLQEYLGVGCHLTVVKSVAITMLQL